MSRSFHRKKRVTRGVAERAVEFYLLARRHGYPPDIAKQYSVHRLEQEAQSGRYRTSGPGPYDLPREGRVRVWEKPFSETGRKHCDPSIFDRLVLPHFVGEEDSPAVRTLVGALLAGEGCGYALKDALLEAGRPDLAELVC